MQAACSDCAALTLDCRQYIQVRSCLLFGRYSGVHACARKIRIRRPPTSCMYAPILETPTGGIVRKSSKHNFENIGVFSEFIEKSYPTGLFFIATFFGA